MTKDEQVDAAEVMLKHAQGFRVEGTSRRRECWRLVDSKPNWDWVRFKFRVAEGSTPLAFMTMVSHTG